MYYTLLLISELAKNLYNDWKLFFFLTDPIVILTFIWLVAWIWSSPSAALHTILLKTLKFAFIIIYFNLMFEWQLWIILKLNQNKTAADVAVVHLLERNLPISILKTQMHFYLEMLNNYSTTDFFNKKVIIVFRKSDDLGLPKSWLSNPCDSIHTIKIESWWGCTAIPDATQHRMASNNNYDCRLHCRLHKSSQLV